MTRTIAAVALLAAACASPAPRPVSEPPRPPAPAREIAKPPPSPTKVVDPAGVQEIFEDPERRKKLATAFPEIDAAVERAQKDLKLPGLAVAIVIDGELAHVATAGHQEIASKTPVTPDSVFRIGSVTKTLTAAAIVRLRDAGKLSLRDPVVKYLPELASLRYPTKDSPLVTLEHLLVHTSGLQRQPPEGELPKALDGAPLAFAPGSASSYSNLGFALLGIVVERVSKMPYREYMAKSFFEPLGLKSAGWERARLPAHRVALPYETKKDGSFVVVTEEEQLGRADASGGLYLSVTDLARWVGWNLDAYPARSSEDAGPLRRASIRETHAPTAALRVGVGKPFTLPGSFVAEPWAGASALGWDASALCGLDLVEKGGFVERYQTDVGVFPNEGIGIAVLTNTGHVGGLKRRAFFDVLRLLQKTGGLARRVRTARSTPALDAALGRLLDVMHAWDEAKYLAMLTEKHKKDVPTAREKAELAGYFALHGRCQPEKIVRFDTSERARYRLACERGKLVMDIALEDGLIAGFVGTSTDVSISPDLLARAKTELAKKNKCKLGALRDRDGNGWYRFDTECKTGPRSVFAMRVVPEDPSTVEEVVIEPVPSGPCAVLEAVTPS